MPEGLEWRVVAASMKKPCTRADILMATRTTNLDQTRRRNTNGWRDHSSRGERGWDSDAGETSGSRSTCLKQAQLRVDYRANLRRCRGTRAALVVGFFRDHVNDRDVR